ncbi:MAG: MMPL family transporter [Frankia sp.]|nr:MMPL family transporter [Frankia sp.]
MALGMGAFGKLQAEGFDDPGSEASRARAAIEERFGGAPDLLLLVTARDGNVDDPAVADAGRALTGELAATPGVTDVASYWTGAGPALRSADGGDALIVGSIADPDLEPDIVAKYEEMADNPGDGPVTVRPGGAATVGEDVNRTVSADLATAESIAIPVTMVLLVIVFGGLAAAALPLFVGLIGIVGGFAALSVVAEATDVSVFAINLATSMGLGLGIDYALLMVSRFREELATGRDRRAAAAATVRTAGRTILFSGATVMVALAVMLVFPPYFLKSMAYAGIAVTAVTMLTAVLALPAVLVLLGERVNSLRVGGLIGLFRRRRARAAAAAGAGTGDARVPREAVESPFWRRVAGVVMRRPLLTGLPVVGLLLVLATPVLHIDFAIPDDRVLPTSASSRAVGDAIREEFGSNLGGAVEVFVDGTADPATIAPYAAELSEQPGVDRVDSVAGLFQDGALAEPPGPAAARFAADGATYLQVVPSVEPVSDEGRDLVLALREVPAPEGTEALVGGQPAFFVDILDAMSSRLPLAIGLIALATFVLLFLFTGSVVLPVKAIVLNGLVLGAVLGVSVWVFEDGHLSGLLGFTPGPLDTSMPVLLFCIAFGLSMDYEVFLLSRIKEEHDAGAANAEAVSTGLARTGRIVTAAALLLAVTFAAFTTSSVRFMQMFGLATALAILLDATLVRGVLVPAFMRIAGRANWWSPAPLRRLHARIGISDAPSAPAAAASVPRQEGADGQGSPAAEPASTSAP